MLLSEWRWWQYTQREWGWWMDWKRAGRRGRRATLRHVSHRNSYIASNRPSFFHSVRPIQSIRFCQSYIEKSYSEIDLHLVPGSFVNEVNIENWINLWAEASHERKTTHSHGGVRITKTIFTWNTSILTRFLNLNWYVIKACKSGSNVDCRHYKVVRNRDQYSDSQVQQK